MATYHILAIDGGGIKGIIPAMVLCEIEQRTGKRISELFNLIAGTSTGGILALGLNVPGLEGRAKYTARDLLNLYIDPKENSKIFGEERLSGKESYKYKTPEIFDEKFEDVKMSSCITDVMIIGNEANSVSTAMVGAVGTPILNLISVALGRGTMSLPPRKVHLFTKEGVQTCSYTLNMESEINDGKLSSLAKVDLDMSLVAKITSAAPTYFPSVSLTGKTMLDGGMLQNNPGIPAFLASKGQKIALVSISTGADPCPKPKSIGEAAFNVLSEVVQSQIFENSYLEENVGSNSYYRFEHVFKPGTSPAMDKIDTNTIEMLMTAGGNLIEKESAKIDELCKRLLAKN